jgi:hypothetical protein
MTIKLLVNILYLKAFVSLNVSLLVGVPIFIHSLQAETTKINDIYWFTALVQSNV